MPAISISLRKIPSCVLSEAADRDEISAVIWLFVSH